MNRVVAFYDIYGKKGEMLFFCFVPDTTRDNLVNAPNTLDTVFVVFD
jgi:hypothetical protein